MATDTKRESMEVRAREFVLTWEPPWIYELDDLTEKITVLLTQVGDERYREGMKEAAKVRTKEHGPQITALPTWDRAQESMAAAIWDKINP